MYNKLDSMSSSEMIECLDAFVKNIDFVKWLRNHAPSK